MIIGINGYIGAGKDTVATMIPYIFGQYKTHGQLYDKFDSNDSLGYQSYTGWKIRKFAYRLKQMASLLTGIPVEDLEKQEVKARELGPEWSIYWFKHKVTGVYTMVPFDTKDIEGFKRRYVHIGGDNLQCNPITVRDLLQKLGTDAVRDKLHPNAWVNALMADYQPMYSAGIDPYKTVVTEKDISVTSKFPNWVISDCRFPNESQAIKDRGGVVWRINRPLPTIIPRERGDIGGQYQTIERHSSETSLDNWNFDRTIENDGSLEELLTKVLVALQEGGFL